jgi:hypothetical protein
MLLFFVEILSKLDDKNPFEKEYCKIFFNSLFAEMVSLSLAL